jgi:membrane-bound serine protease (ClpP class)
MIGLEGKVVTMLSPKGMVKIRGELWKAAALEATVEVGDSIVVVGIEGLKLLVKPQHPNMESEASF